MNLRYFDHNATTPLAPAARSAWLDAADNQWMNPSSPYRNAAAAKVRLESAREEIAGIFNVVPERVVFCSGATEANNAVFRNWADCLPSDARVAVSPVEHSSVLEAAKFYFGDRTVWLDVDGSGRVNLDVLYTLIANQDIAAVSIMAANNETGVLQPWAEIAQRCVEAGIDYHCDASQWVGKMSCSTLAKSSYVSACAHKFGGPKGVGFLILPNAQASCQLLFGGEQEAGHRAGTEDVAGVLSMLAALKESSIRSSELRDAFESEICQRLKGVELIAADTERLWNTTSLLMPEFKSVRWIRALERAGFLVSSGSACSTGSNSVSHVLLAMGIDSTSAGRVLRISSGSETTSDCWKALADALCEAYSILREESADIKSQVISLD